MGSIDSLAQPLDYSLHRRQRRRHPLLLLALEAPHQHPDCLSTSVHQLIGQGLAEGAEGLEVESLALPHPTCGCVGRQREVVVEGAELQ